MTHFSGILGARRSIYSTYSVQYLHFTTTPMGKVLYSNTLHYAVRVFTMVLTHSKFYPPCVLQYSYLDFRLYY